MSQARPTSPDTSSTWEVPPGAPPEGQGAVVLTGLGLRGLTSIAYGGDYNPEQWPPQVWEEDVELMRQAGVNLVSLGIFSWVLLEPSEGRFTFDWLDRIMDMLHKAGIFVDLGTPTAVPPAWFFRAYPQARPVDREGHVLGGGYRQTFCPSSPEYAAAATRITEQLARRYGDHPALALWHVHNEYGQALTSCYCPVSAAAFRRWLRARYADDLAALNEAWGTTFWGQCYSDWEEIEPPRLTPHVVNPSQQLDFMRFSSDELLKCFQAERDILHALSPGVPVTTNFQIANCKGLDYWRWASEVDVVSNDHYLQAERADNYIELAMCADLTRGAAGGRPWLLMEHSTSAVNWQPRNIAKRPREMRRNSLAHLARGANGVMFFQWRASRFGAEKFHSAMVPHGGTETRIWREVTELGADLATLSAKEPELLNTQVLADIAMVWDWESWWALELPWRPSVDLNYRERVEAYYTRLWHHGLTVDFVQPTGDLTRYPLVVVPSLYLTTQEAAANLTSYVDNGGTLLVSYFSGIVDEHDTIYPGSHPGALREVLGLKVEEFLPLRAGEQITVEPDIQADVWAEHIVPTGAEVVLRYLDGPAAGGPAVTRHRFGRGQAWYVSTRPDSAGLDSILRRVYADAGLAPRELPPNVEVVRRTGNGVSYLIAINHSDQDVTVLARGVEPLTGIRRDGTLPIPAGEVRILREE